MARYFFHVFCDGDVHMDENGQVFSGLQGAKARAATIARKLAEDGYCAGYGTAPFSAKTLMAPGFQNTSAPPSTAAPTPVKQASTYKSNI